MLLEKKDINDNLQRTITMDDMQGTEMWLKIKRDKDNASERYTDRQTERVRKRPYERKKIIKINFF